MARGFTSKAKSFNLVGLGELMENLEILGTKVGKEATRRAVNRSIDRMVDLAKSKVPVDSGLLKESLGKKVKTYRRSGSVTGFAGPRVGFEKQLQGPTQSGATVGETAARKPTKYSHLVEFGTAHSAAKPFMRPAFDAVETTFLPEVAETVERAVKRMVKKSSIAAARAASLKTTHASYKSGAALVRALSKARKP